MLHSTNTLWSTGDNAHLKDEKLRIINLFKLRAILTDTFKELGMS